jgi:hypothetical protein
MDQAPSADVPILNDSTWTLSMPVPEVTDLKALAAAAERLPGGAGVKIEATTKYRASDDET